MYRNFEELIKIAPSYGYRIEQLATEQFKVTNLRGEPLLSVPTTRDKVESFLGTMLALKERRN